MAAEFHLIEMNTFAYFFILCIHSSSYLVEYWRYCFLIGQID